MSEVVNIPQLRFPDYKSHLRSGTLGEFGYFYYGKSAPKWSLTEGAKTPCVRYGELYSTYNEYISSIKSYTDITPESLKFSKGGEVLVPRVGEDPLDFANCSYLPISGVAIGEMISVYNTEEDGLFFTYFINAKLKKAFARVVEGGSVSNLYYKYLEDIEITIPEKQEQQKIASFLTSVDTKIKLLTKKQELLKKYKKGLMQKIFSQEIRFKADDGSDYPDWEEKKLGDVLDNVGGTALEKHTNPNSKYKFISIGNYGVNGKYIDNGQRVELNDKTKTKLLDKNNLVMVLNDKTAIGDIIGSTILIDKNDNYIYNQRSERLICKLELLPIFAWHYLNSRMFRRSVYSISQGGTQIYVNFPSVKDLKFNLPSKTEQIKISNFLSSVDSKIEQIGKQLDETKQFKKALLQQMFA